jgi:hypothetical protein
MRYKRDYVRIENLKQFLTTKHKSYHPDDPRYVEYWKIEKQKCIEGVWGREFGKYRYMPGRLYFYGNYGTILDIDKRENTRISVRPLIRDIEWERAYMVLEAEGFSGWSNDDKFTSDSWRLELDAPLSNEKVITLNQDDKDRYFEMIDSNGKLKKYKSPRENIRELHDENMGVPLYWNTTKNILELGCLHKDTNIRMFDGTLKRAEDIEIGDKLMGPDSTEREVKKLVRGEGIMYDVSTRYGDKYRVTDSHIHRLRKHGILPKNNKRSQKINYTKDINLDTNQILDLDKDYLKRSYEAIIQDIEYPEKSLEFDPYFIGYWLGDGFKKEKLICYNEDDKTIIEPWLINYANNNNWDYSIKKVTPSKSYMGNKKMFRFRLNTGKNNYWNNTFKNNKHIPQEYLINSRENRLKLLAGLLDSDGSYDKTRFKFFNSDFKLIKQVQDLCRSLGFKCTLNRRRGGINNSINYYLQITGDIHLIPNFYPRKKAKKPNTQGSRRNHINIDITTGKIEKFYGFEVDKDNLFLLEDYTVTHNARGGGKSYFYAIAVCLHTVVFNGSKYYTKDSILKPKKAEVCVGSGEASKSSEFCAKIEDAMNELAVNHDFGVWKAIGDDDYEPSIFYKEMSGSLESNNKAKRRLWQHRYKVLEGGREITEGTGSYVSHVVYSPQKTGGAEAAAGGRYNFVVYEEAGLTSLLIRAWESNRSTVGIGQSQFGVQIGLGTSGNMDTVQPAKEIFTNPISYGLVMYNDDWEESGNIGFFLPAYLTDKSFKDENGNTDYDRAIAFYLKQRENAMDANNPYILSMEKMNNPLVPSDMWQSDKGYYLPVIEAEQVEKELLANKTYQKNYTPVKLYWDSNKPYGVWYEVDKSKKPFFEHRFRYAREDLEAPIMIYEFPETIKGDIPPDMYQFVGHDPYVADDPNDGDSLGATYIIMNPKYIQEGYNGNTIVASYIGKPYGGRKAYYENLEKLLAFYGNPHRGLWFEADRGDECKNYFVNKNKSDLLCLRPTRTNNANIYQGKVTKYGFIVGNKTGKVELINKLSDWLLEETTIQGVTKRNIERIPCIFLVRQIIAFDMKKGNYDAVSALAGAVLGLKEKEHQIEEELLNKHKHNRLGFLSSQNKLFKHGFKRY